MYMYTLMHTHTHTHTRISTTYPIQAMFLNLLFKSVKSDPEINRVKAFLKRILQICSTHSPPFICGCLFLISEVSFLGMAIECVHTDINVQWSLGERDILYIVSRDYWVYKPLIVCIMCLVFFNDSLYVCI